MSVRRGDAGIDQRVRGACHGAARAAGLRLPRALVRDLPACGAGAPAPALGWSDPARSLGAFHERLLEEARDGAATRRKRSGSYYTPDALIRRVLDAALDPLLRPGARPRVCDPACGSGLFLVAGAARIEAACGATRGEAAALVHGVDISPAAVAIARTALWVWSAGRADPAVLAAQVRVGDALLDGALASERFDAVVGNPPFLNQLESATAVSRRRAAALAARYGGVARGYADTSAVFLDLATRITRPCGMVAMVQPQSVLAARDAGPARAGVLSRAALVELWAEPAQGKRLFGAGVRICVPVLRIHAPGEVEAKPSAATWTPRLGASRALPEPAFEAAGTLAEYATATADFRDQYYGLRGAVHERPRPDRGHPMLVTTGLIDPAACRWGRRPARLLGAAWLRPCAELGALDAEMRRWAAQRLVPKVLLATQTRALEAWVDERGAALPVVPLITIVPRAPGDLWRLAAAVSSPIATLWAVRHFAGAGLSADAIKLSARQTLQIPTPRPGPEWDRAAALFRRAADSADDDARAAHLLGAGEAMVAAYGVPPARARPLLAWWAQRLVPRRRRAPAPS